MLIEVGFTETMLVDNKLFYIKAKKVNLKAIHEIWQDMFHGCHNNAYTLKDTQNAIISIGKVCIELLKEKILLYKKFCMNFKNNAKVVFFLKLL